MNEIFCPNCQTRNQPDAAVCARCAWNLADATAALEVKNAGVVIPLPAAWANIVVGREDSASGSDPEIKLNHFGAEEGGVSRRHAILSARGGDYTIRDLNSTNFTIVNGRRLAPDAPPLALSPGDEIRLGRVVVFFRRG